MGLDWSCSDEAAGLIWQLWPAACNRATVETQSSARRLIGPPAAGERGLVIRQGRPEISMHLDRLWEHADAGGWLAGLVRAVIYLSGVSMCSTGRNAIW